jgi:transcriptional regulator
MHPNPAFRTTPHAENLRFARARGFGTLCLNGDAGPLISHVPFVMDDAGGQAELHLVRSNPIVRAVTGPAPAVLAVTGPDGYVSPDWYGDADQVPTWNYVAVHLRGLLEPGDPEAMRAHLDRVSAEFEGRLPKRAWTPSKMNDETLARMMRMILPFRFTVQEVQGTWKLNQNKPDAMRLAAAEAMEASHVGQELGALAALMRQGGAEMDKT